MSSASAAARRRPCDQRARCDGATLPTWLEISRSRRLWNASPSGAATSPLPYQLNSTMLASSPASRSAVAKPAAVPLAWNTRSQSAGAAPGGAKRTPSACASAARAPDDVDQRHLRPRQPRAKIRDQQADQPRAHDHDAIGRPGRAVPDRIERGLHIGREHGAPRRYIVGNGKHGFGRHGKQALVGMQAENDTAAQFGHPVRDPPHGRVAVFHRKRKRPAHTRRAHAVVFARRHPAGQNEALGAATDGAEERVHLHLAGPGRGNRLNAQLGAAGTDIPEGFALRFRHRVACHVPVVTTRRPAARPAMGRAGDRVSIADRLPPDWTSTHAAISSKRRKDTQSPAMLERSPRDAVVIAAPPALLAWRRALFFASVGLTMVGLTWLAVVALSPGGFGTVDLVLVVLFAVTLPWYVIGFWNAAVGLLIMRFARDPVAAVTPVAGRLRGDEPITASTAILMCIRNEPPERVARLLEPMLAGLAARGVGERFQVYVLSDTNDADTAAAEERVLRRWRRHGAGGLR